MTPVNQNMSGVIVQTNVKVVTSAFALGRGFDLRPSHAKDERGMYKNGTSCFLAWRSAYTRAELFFFSLYLKKQTMKALKPGVRCRDQ